MNPMAVPTKEQVTEALEAVIDPELRRSIVELGMVRSVEIGAEGRIEVVVSLTTPGCPIRSHFQQAVAEQVGRLDGVTHVGVGFDVLSNGVQCVSTYGPQLVVPSLSLRVFPFWSL